MNTAAQTQRKHRPAQASDLLPIGGIQPLTTTDYPGKLALVVFTQGCPWRCPYCHNAALQTIQKERPIEWIQVVELLEARREFLDAVVFSGGEPTLHAGLKDALHAVRAMGFLTGLHTAGVYPERLAGLLPLLDWVGLDIKAPFDQRYCELTHDPNCLPKVLESLQLMLRSNLSFQLRTTVGAGALSEEDFETLNQQLRSLQAPESVRQVARPVGL